MLKLQANYGFHELFLNKKVIYQIWCARLVSGITFIKIIEIIESQLLITGSQIRLSREPVNILTYLYLTSFFDKIQ
jgi:hypothetical protein